MIDKRQEYIPIKALHHNLKTMIWIYFILIIFEGALRKWIFPSMSDLLLIIRDPLAIVLLFSAFKEGLLKTNIYTFGFIFIGVLGFFIAIFFGHQNIIVALFGARIFIIHLPLIFVIGRIFNKTDVVNIGKTLLWISIPMLMLIILQFFSPQTAWINNGVGNSENSGIGGALDYFRPPATFSYANGNSLFWGLLAPYIYYFWIKSCGVNRILLFASTIALLASIYFSISRTILFEICLSSFFSLIVSTTNKQRIYRIIGLIILIILIGCVLSQLQIFQTGKMVFLARFSSAAETEGNVVSGTLYDRYLNKGLFDTFNQLNEISIVGNGIGANSNFAAKYLGPKYGISDFEWPRQLEELGLILGLIVIGLRVSLVVGMIKKYYRRLVPDKILPFLLLSFGIPQLIQGQFAQPTSLGFITLIGGLFIASLNQSNTKQNKHKNEGTSGASANATLI